MLGRELSSVLCGDLEAWNGAGVGGRPKRKGIYVYTNRYTSLYGGN